MFRLFDRSPSSFAIARYVPAVSSVLTTVLGALVLVGWLTGNLALIRICPLLPLPAMQYHTAFCFGLLGLGFGLLLLGRRSVSVFCATVVAAWAGIALSEYVVGWDLADTLWMEPFITGGPVSPERMAPMTAICHLMAATALFLASRSRTWALGSALLISSSLCAVSVSVAFGFLANLPTKFWWGPAVRMSSLGALGFLVFGAGIGSYVWQQALQAQRRMFVWAMVSLELALVLVTVGLSQSMTVLRQADIQRVLEQQIEAARDAIVDDLNQRAGHLERMAERWRVRGGTPQEEWEHDAENFVNDLRGCYALERFNRSAELEWVVPPGKIWDLAGQKYLSAKNRKEAWERAHACGKAYTSALMPLIVGGEGFLTIVPVYRHNESDGAIVAAYRLADWLPTIFSERASFSDYEMAVLHKGKEVYRSGQGDASTRAAWTKVRDIQFDDLRLRVQVWPNSSLQSSMRSSLPEAVLLVGVALSTLLTWSISLLRSVRDQGRALSDANDRLRDQMQRLRRTEQSLQESTRLRQAIIEGASYPIFSVDVEGTVTSFNKAASQALGYLPEEVVGCLRGEVFHDREEFARFRLSLEAQEASGERESDSFGNKGRVWDEPLQREFSFVRKDGSRFPGKLAISALRDEAGMVAGYVAIIYDLTQAKLAEEAIRTARDVAEQANEAKSLFLANMSHEVRTPLNAIIGINQMLLESKLQPDQRLWVRTLQDSAESLLTIVNDILDFSKVEAGQVELESIEFSLGKTLEQVSRLYGPKASVKGVTLQLEIEKGTPQRLIGDPTRLLQVLNNLVSNAIKFTERGNVDVKAAVSGWDGDKARVRFDVVDSGIGMGEETRSRIFDPFAQADASTTRRFGGTGLGLSICRLLVERMGGEIHVESEPGKGSRFWFVVQLQVAENAAGGGSEASGEQEREVPPIEWSTISVLLADDSATNRLVAKHQLQKLGCRVEVAQNGREALARLDESQFDVVLMDGQMPEMDGYEATMELRRREGEGRRTLVVALTANAMPGERERCLAVGMDHYLSKPFKAHQLEAVLSEVLNRPRAVQNHSNK